MSINRSKDEVVFDRIILIISIIIFIVVAYPLWFIVIASISNSDLVSLGEVKFLPKDIRLFGFEQVFQDSRIWNGYFNTAIYVVFGTLLNMVVTLPAAYALSRKEFKARHVVMTYFVITMFFNGGLIPLYMTVSSLNLISTRTIQIIFLAMNTYNLIIARTFMQTSIPQELYESAIMDGCGHFRFFIQIVIPLSKAIIAVLILYYAVYHWNDYFNALIFNNKTQYEPLQITLRRILVLNEAFEGGSGQASGGYAQSFANQIKYAVMIVSTVPILIFYPFIQKYFAKGVLIGSIKG